MTTVPAGSGAVITNPSRVGFAVPRVTVNSRGVHCSVGAPPNQRPDTVSERYASRHNAALARNTAAATLLGDADNAVAEGEGSESDIKERRRRSLRARLPSLEFRIERRRSERCETGDSARLAS